MNKRRTVSIGAPLILSPPVGGAMLSVSESSIALLFWHIAQREVTLYDKNSDISYGIRTDAPNWNGAPFSYCAIRTFVIQYPKMLRKCCGNRP